MFCAWSQNTQCFLLQKKNLTLLHEWTFLFIFSREILFSLYFFSHQIANHRHGRQNNFDQTKKVNHQKKKCNCLLLLRASVVWPEKKTIKYVSDFDVPSCIFFFTSSSSTFLPTFQQQSLKCRIKHLHSY